MYVVDNKADIVGIYVSDTEMMELDQKTFDSLVASNRRMSNDYSLNTGDSNSGQLAAKFKDAGLEVYLLETTSDKEINARQYKDSAIMDSAKGGWTKDFQKPIMTDHIISANWGDTPTMLGRVKDSYYVRRDSGKVMSCTKNDLPNQVKAFFLDKEKTGTGFNILKADINDKGVQGIIDGEFVTFSQGSIYTKADCNICGHNYNSEDCSHRVGQSYEKDGKQFKCVPILDGRRPVEVSQVYTPANDTSQKIVFNKKTGKIMSDEEVIKLLNDCTPSGSNDSSQSNEGEVTNDSTKPNQSASNTNNDNQEGGAKVLNTLLKNAVLDTLELQLEKVATDEFKTKMLEIFSDVTTDEELELMRRVAKVLGTSKLDDYKFEVAPANDSQENDGEGDETNDSQGNEEQNNGTNDNSQEGQTEIDMTNMTDVQKAAFEKMKKDLEEVNAKLAKANDTISNNPFASTDNSNEGSNEESTKNDGNNDILENGSYFPGL